MNRCKGCKDILTGFIGDSDYCDACAKAPVRRSRSALFLARRPERRETIVERSAYDNICDICGKRSRSPGRRHDACAEAVERGEDTVAAFGNG